MPNTEHRPDRPGSCSFHSLMTRTDARACHAVIPDPSRPGHLTYAHPPHLQDAHAPPLLTYLACSPDPRAARGRPHPLAAILGLAAAAVLAGATSIAAIAEWAADTPQQVRGGVGGR